GFPQSRQGTLFIPLRDDNSLKSIPFQYVTVGLIVLNALVFALEVSGLSEAAVASFGVRIARQRIPGDAEPTSGRWFLHRRARDAPHLHVLPCGRVPSRRQHAVSVGVRRQRRDR